MKAKLKSGRSHSRNCRNNQSDFKIEIKAAEAASAPIRPKAPEEIFPRVAGFRLVALDANGQTLDANTFDLNGIPANALSETARIYYAAAAKTLYDSLACVNQPEEINAAEKPEPSKQYDIQDVHFLARLNTQWLSQMDGARRKAFSEFLCDMIRPYCPERIPLTLPKFEGKNLLISGLDALDHAHYRFEFLCRSMSHVLEHWDVNGLVDEDRLSEFMQGFHYSAFDALKEFENGITDIEEWRHSVPELKPKNI